MRRCQRFGCPGQLPSHARADAHYCSPTCAREARRARSLTTGGTASGDFWSAYSRVKRPRRGTRPRVAVLALLASLLILAGCGGGHATSILGHRCSKSDPVLQCQLPPAPRNLQLPVGVSAHGIDFGWSCPSPSGLAFGASYFSPDISKNWTVGCVSRYHGVGAKTVGVWESSANRAQQGYQAGFNDAYRARSQARSVGEPDSRPIDYAVDCDCPGSSLTGYFQGADAGTASVLHITRTAAVRLVGAYGGYSQVLALSQAGLVGHTNWQTYAWSGGRWLPASIAPLEQYLNGNAYDNDRAIAADYGQWPYAVTPRPVDRYAVLPVAYVHIGRSRLSERATVKAYDARGCHHRPRRDGACGHYRRELKPLEQRIVQVVRQDRRGGWHANHRRLRFQIMTRRSA